MTDGTTTFESPSPEELSNLLSGYEVRSIVSTGVMGAIYEAHQISLDRKVMIKVLPPSIGKNPSLRSAFEVEAKTMARLNDPNLVEIFDFGDISGMLYIIMEHVPGRSLSEVTQGSHVDVKESSRLISDVCSGLSHAHKEGVIHRALSPQNILINKEAQPKIVDFGIAALFADTSASPSNPFSAPECLTHPDAVDHRADIYSAGMILYTLVVGHLPKNPYTPPSSVRNCRHELDHVCYKALQPDPSERYSSAEEMAKGLDAMLDKMGAPPTQQAIKTLVTSAPSSAGRPLARPISIPAQNNNTSAVVVSILVVAVIAGIIAIVVSSNTNTAEKSSSTTHDQSPLVTKPAPSIASGSELEKPDNSTTATKPNPRSSNPRGRKPKLKPRPQPEPEPQPDPEPKEESTPEVADNNTDIEPEAKPAPPEFDREDWLENARDFMRKKAISTLREYDEDLLKNIDRFERDVKRAIRRMNRDKRKPAEIANEQAFETLRANGRLPETLPKDATKQMKELHKEALLDQEKIELEYLENFTRLRITYTQGLDKQVIKLRQEGNDEHADAIHQEITATQKDMQRFIRILRNQEPDPEPETKDKKKKDD